MSTAEVADEQDSSISSGNSILPCPLDNFKQFLADISLSLISRLSPCLFYRDVCVCVFVISTSGRLCTTVPLETPGLCDWIKFFHPSIVCYVLKLSKSSVRHCCGLISFCSAWTDDLNLYASIQTHKHAMRDQKFAGGIRPLAIKELSLSVDKSGYHRPLETHHRKSLRLRLIVTIYLLNLNLLNLLYDT